MAGEKGNKWPFMAKLDFIVWLKTNHCIQWNSFGSKAKQKRIGLLYFLPYSIEGMSQTVCGLVMCSTNPTTMGFQTTLPSSVLAPPTLNAKFPNETELSITSASIRSRGFAGVYPNVRVGGDLSLHILKMLRRIRFLSSSVCTATSLEKILPPALPWWRFTVWVRNTCTGVRTPRRLDRDWIYALNWTQVDGRRLRRRCIQCTGFSEAQIEHIRS